MTLAPATAIFLPTLIWPLRIALAMGSSTLARSLYHPSVTSNSGCDSAGKPSSSPADDQVTFDTQSTIGDAAGASLVVISRSGGRDDPFKSRSYLGGRSASEGNDRQTGATCTTTDESLQASTTVCDRDRIPLLVQV